MTPGSDGIDSQGLAEATAQATSLKRNALARDALITSILGLAFAPCLGLGTLASLPGLVLAYRARRQIRQSGETGYSAATIGIITGWAGLVLGLVAMAMIVWWLTHAQISACHFMPCDPVGDT